MCNFCDVVDVHLALAEAEEAIILAEAADGYSVPGASRPLTEAERAAGTRFGDIAELHDSTEAEAAGILGDLEAVIESTITSAIFAAGISAVSPPTILRALAALNVAQPKAVQDAAALAAGRLTDVFKGAYSRSARILLDEAARQGSKPAKLAKIADVPASDFAAPAASAALYPWTRTTSKLQAIHGSPAALAGPDVTRADLSKTLGEIPIDGALDTARQGINQAVARGRHEAAETLGPEEIWASELLDSATCGPCQAIDGKEYATLADARADYPHGGYRSCDGGARCRGTLIFQFPIGSETPPPPPNLTPPPDPKPSPPIAPAPVPAPAKPPATPAPAPAAPAPAEAPPLPRRPKGQPQRFETVSQLPRFTGPKPSPRELVKGANPEHDKSYKSKVYNSNCTNVISAVEMRRRGYDVTAAPVKGGRGRYDRDYLPHWRDPATGLPPVYRKHENGADLVADILANEPMGARGVVKVIWGDGGGHVFNYERTGDTVQFWEGQTGIPEANDHFAKVRRGSVGHFRMDHLEPTDLLAREAVEARTPEYLAEKAAKDALEAKKAESVGKPYRSIEGGWDYKPPTYVKQGRDYVRIPAAERERLRQEWFATHFPGRPVPGATP